MLAVLSEIHCLEYLQERGIFPDEYFTDFEEFKNRCVSYRDATIVIILAGICHFSRRHIVELIKLQYKRMENDSDKGIQNVYVLTDSLISNLESYYKFSDNMEIFDKYSKTRKVESKIDVWELIDDAQNHEAHEIRMYLSKFDTGETGDIIEMIKSKFSSEDELIRLIKIPNVRELMSAR